MQKNLLLHVALAILIFFPGKHFAQSPTLGSLDNYVFFTSVGAITNTQRSLLIGNVGTNSGSISGFGNVNGNVNTANGPTNSANGELVIASAQLSNTITPDTIPGVIPSTTVFPGKYYIDGDASLAGNLTLDAQGDPLALFIIKVSGTFSAGPLSSITLINDAKACNVYCYVAGVVNLQGGIMKGTIINGAAINMSPGTNLEGRALSTGGAIGLDKVNARLPVGCGSIILTGPPAPELGSVSQFGLFTAVGAIADGYNSYVRGSIGSNSAGSTNFDPLKVSDTIYAAPNDSTAAAALDLMPVYDYLNNMSADITLEFPADFGHSLTLTPHSYLLAAATMLTDTVFIDAQGNPDAVFIIKINGVLNTSSGSQVVLLNGAQAKNVYWKVSGAVDIAVNSLFSGTLVVYGAIALQTNAVLQGRAWTMNGAITTDGTSVIMNQDGTLPVTWLSFEGKTAGENVQLEWSTANEINNGFYTILKSRDGSKFDLLATVRAQGENKNSQYFYTFTDRLPYSNGYYSISQTDIDGKKSYYKTIQVKMNINAGFKAIHYLQQDHLYLQTSGAAAAKGTVKLYDLSGRLISSQNILLTKDISTYKITKPVHKGIYLLIVDSYGERLYNKKVMLY